MAKRIRVAALMIVPILSLSCGGKSGNKSAARPFTPTPLFKALPADAPLYVSFENTAESIAAAKGLAMMKMVEDPEVAAFIKSLQEKVKELQGATGSDPQAMVEKFIAQVETKSGVQLRKLQQGAMRIELAILGLVPPSEGMPFPLPRIAIAADLGETLTHEQIYKVLDAAIQTGMERAGMKGLTIARQQVAVGGDVKGQAYTLPGPLPIQVVFVSQGDRLYATLGVTQAKSLVESLTNPPAKSLGGSDDFQTVQKQLGSQGGGNLVYVNLTSIQQIVYQLMGPMGVQIKETLAKLGLDGVAGIGATTWVDASGFGERAFLLARSPRRGIPKVLAFKKLDKEALNDLPPSAHVGLAVGIEPRATFDEILKMVFAMDPREQENFEQELGQMTKMLGFNMVDDLLPAVGDSLAVAVSLREDELIPDVVATMALKDEAKFRDCLAKLRAAFMDGPGQRFTPESFEGKMRRNPLEAVAGGFLHADYRQSLDVPEAGAKIEYVTLPMGPSLAACWTLHEGRFHASLSLNSLKKFLVDRKAGKSFRDAENLKAAATAVPADASALMFLDLKGIAGYVYKQLLPLAEKQLAPNKEAAAKILPLLRKLPHLETIQKYLSPEFSWCVVNDDGIQSVSRGMMGGGAMQVSAIAAVVAAIAIPSLLSSRKAANETKAIGAMMAISVAQATYRRKSAVYASTLQMLVDDGGLDFGIAASQADYSGYTIFIIHPTDVTGANSDKWRYGIGVTPVAPGESGDMSYYSNAKATVWQMTTKTTALTKTDTKWPGLKGEDGDGTTWQIAGQ